MSTRMKIAFGCYLLTTFILAVFGIIYLLRSEFIPYHSVAVGMPWNDVPSSFQILILALMKAVGSSYITFFITALILLFIPFRQGKVWAKWALPVLGLLNCAGGLYAMLYVKTNTTANPPWIASVIAALLLVVGFIFSLERSE